MRAYPDLIRWGQVMDGYKWPRLAVEFSPGFAPDEGRGPFLERLFPGHTVLHVEGNTAEVLKPGYTEEDRFPAYAMLGSPPVTGLVPEG